MTTQADPTAARHPGRPLPASTTSASAPHLDVPMTASPLIAPDEIRARFSRAMSDMYRAEVPLYGDLMALVADVNAAALAADPALGEHLALTGEIERLDLERHGAIRLGTAAELATMGRLFAVMGMQAVGYYDLIPAGVPVHATAFRAVHDASLAYSPFRVFTSLLRLELIPDAALRAEAGAILARRRIFTPGVLELIEANERQGGLDQAQAAAFVAEALETFRWHSEATVDADTYRRLHDQHRLIADVVAFKGPHINHLTPRTLDIDAVQAGMPARGITPKAVIEGPPTRRHPILLRQTSFKALQEAVGFVGAAGTEGGHHTARFGEIEQRGAALTTAGRALYDRLLGQARAAAGPTSEANAAHYARTLAEHFGAFPDDLAQMHAQGLAWFRYFVTDAGRAAAGTLAPRMPLQALIEAGLVRYETLVYEDFLPVSAAGIFQSNLGDGATASYDAAANRAGFEQALGAPVLDEIALYADSRARSLQACAAQLGVEIVEH